MMNSYISKEIVGGIMNSYISKNVATKTFNRQIERIFFMSDTLPRTLNFYKGLGNVQIEETPFVADGVEYVCVYSHNEEIPLCSHLVGIYSKEDGKKIPYKVDFLKNLIHALAKHQNTTL